MRGLRTARPPQGREVVSPARRTLIGMLASMRGLRRVPVSLVPLRLGPLRLEHQREGQVR